MFHCFVTSVNDNNIMCHATANIQNDEQTPVPAIASRSANVQICNARVLKQPLTCQSE